MSILSDFHVPVAGPAPLIAPLSIWQIHFPALDIRLSYNDIQLFLAIAKSIPTASTPPASRSDTSHTLSTEMDDLRREDLREKAEAVSGMQQSASAGSTGNTPKCP